MKRYCFPIARLGALLAVLAAGAWAQTAAYTIHRDTGAVSLEAFGAEAWRSAETIEWGPEGYKTTFRALWNDRDLWLRFDVEDPSPWHTMTKRDEHLWEEEVVEIFIDLDGTGKDYAEYELSPANVICDVKMESAWPNVKSNLEWNHEGIESAVRMRPASGGDRGGWIGILRLPWKGFHSLPAVSEQRAAAPPKAGTTWKFNLYRVERPGGPAEPRKGAILEAWSPTGKPSFHHPPAFRTLTFSGW